MLEMLHKLVKLKIKTWFRKTRRSEVKKKGADSDKEKQAAPGKLNQSHRKRSTISTTI